MCMSCDYLYLLTFFFSLSSRGTGILSGHADGSIVRFYVAEDSAPEPQVSSVNA